MSYVKIRGGTSLQGEVKVQGSKNAALPILAATLLSEEEIVIENCPKIADVEAMLILLAHLGTSFYWNEHSLHIRAAQIETTEIRKEDTELTRASILVLGAMLGRKRAARIAYPGGCAIGKRPIDYHLDGFRKMNIIIKEEDDTLVCQGEHLMGTTIVLPFPSVGATENFILAAVLAEGTTCIVNAAVEPEIKELCQFLSEAGAKISGIGTTEITIEGVEKLRGCIYHLSSDRIVTGTYLAAATATQGDIIVKTNCKEELSSVLSVLREMGAEIWDNSTGSGEKGIHLKMRNRPKSIQKISTGVYPAFPTDLQSVFMAVLAAAEGSSIIEENIFENRFRTAEELKKMGADIRIKGNTAHISGKKCLYGTHLNAPDLRGGAALVIAAMAAEGITELEQIAYINRGYENYYENLRILGACVELIE